MARKAWIEPKLIVIVRSAPEEAVLQVCKGGARQAYARNQYQKCEYKLPGGSCANCSIITST